MRFFEGLLFDGLLLRQYGLNFFRGQASYLTDQW